jgi:4-carboxymuconolactone decarboxylase
MSKAPASTGLRDQMKAVVPQLIQYSNEILYGQVWERPGLSKRDRSLITVACLFGMARPDFVKTHMERALGNGVTREELSELITHLAFYAGWPAAMSAAQQAKSVFEAEDDGA